MPTPVEIIEQMRQLQKENIMAEYTFTIERPAKKMGGDRYECKEVITNGKPWMIYFPQEISRKDGEVQSSLVAEIKKS